MPRAVVADASALLPAWLPAEKHQEQADFLVQLHADGEIRLHAPTLLAYEVLNALYLAIRSKAGRPPRLTDEGVAERWRLFGALEITLVAVDGLAERIFELARTLAAPSAYDATYAALAEELGAVMVTGDERFINTAKGRLSWVRPVWLVTSKAALARS